MILLIPVQQLQGLFVDSNSITCSKKKTIGLNTDSWVGWATEEGERGLKQMEIDFGYYLLRDVRLRNLQPIQ
jgi:hypothetical protein